MQSIICTTGHPMLLTNIIGSQNCYLRDDNGKQFVDLESGVWCTNIGHNNPRLNGVICDQLSKITHTGFCYSNPVIQQTAHKILELTGLTGGKCEFLCSGSEAVELGLRIARTVVKKPLVLILSDAYFGAFSNDSTKNPQNWYVYDRFNCGCATSLEGCVGECQEFNKIPFGEISTFLFEPGSSMGLVRFPSKKLITKIVERIHNDGGTVLANEVTTGMGRTGKWFGFQHYDIIPDIISLGKGIGNGYPVSVTAISVRVSHLLQNSNFLYSQSHQNDPLGARIALEVIHIMESDGLINSSMEKGLFLKSQLQELKLQFPLIKDVRGRGMMIAIEFHKATDIIFQRLFNLGYIICKRPHHEIIRIDPALTIEMVLLEQFICDFKSLLTSIE